MIPSPLAVLDLAMEIVVAIGDGRVTALEGRDLLEEAGEALDLDALPEFVAFVSDLLRRDADELDEAADKFAARGRASRAAKLRAKAAERRG